MSFCEDCEAFDSQSMLLIYLYHKSLESEVPKQNSPLLYPKRREETGGQDFNRKRDYRIQMYLFLFQRFFCNFSIPQRIRVQLRQLFNPTKANVSILLMIFVKVKT